MKGPSNTNLIASKDNRNARNLQFERETGKAPETTNTSSTGTEGLDDDEDDEEKSSSLTKRKVSDEFRIPFFFYSGNDNVAII